MLRHRVANDGLLWLSKFQHGYIRCLYTSCGHLGGQGRRMPLCNGATSVIKIVLSVSSVFSVVFLSRSVCGRFGSLPRLKISYIVTPNDHTSERDENLPSIKLSGAYLKNHPLYTIEHIEIVAWKNSVLLSIKVLLTTKKYYIWKIISLFKYHWKALM